MTGPETSAAEEIRSRLMGGRLVKAFNTTFARVLSAGGADGTQADVFLASDDDEAKTVVAELARSAGLRPIDAGRLENARILERLMLLMVEVQARYGLDFEAAVKLVPHELARDPLAARAGRAAP